MTQETQTLWLPFHYSLQHRMKQKRNSSYFGVSEEYPFEIRVASVSDVRHVAVVTPATETTKLSTERLATDGRDYRVPYGTPKAAYRLVAYKDALYRPVRLPDGQEFTSDGFTATRHMKNGGSAGFEHVDYPFGGYSAYHSPTREAVMAEVHEFQDDTRQRDLGEALGKASELILAGGVLMRPAPLPIIEVAPFGSVIRDGKRLKGPVLRVLPAGVDTVDSRSVLFTMNEFDAAQELLERFSAINRAEALYDGACECHGSEHAEIDLRRLSRVRYEHSLKGALGISSGDVPTVAVRAWCDARDKAKEAFSADGGDADYSAAIAAAHEFIFHAGENRSDATRLLGHVVRMELLGPRAAADIEVDAAALQI